MKKKYFVWLLAGCMAVTVPNAVLAAENVEEARAEAEAASAAADDAAGYLAEDDCEEQFPQNASDEAGA